MTDKQMTERHGIPTTYNHLRFRSRLEATWARFFDLCGWDWKYEPLDLPGFIPDFVLCWTPPVLVDVKPSLTREDFEKRCDEVSHLLSGHWPENREVLLLGAFPTETDHSPVNWQADLGFLLHAAYDDCGGWVPDRAHLLDCSRCNAISFSACDGRWACRRCGAGHKEWFSFGRERATGEWLQVQWHLAQNLVQWAPRTFGAE